MHPLRISKLTLQILICFTSVSMSLDRGAADYTGCRSVPYPFGALGHALEGFEVVCTSAMDPNCTKNLASSNSMPDELLNPSLRLPTGLYLIQNISLQGQIRIYTGPIYRQCNDTGTVMLTHGEGWLDLTGTPFSVSKNYTTFVAIGCNDIVLLEDVGRGGADGGEKFRSVCTAFCNNDDFIINGSCSGVGCCQMALPGPKGLKRFSLKLFSVQDIRGDRISNCSTAFLTEDTFSFSTSFFYNGDSIDLTSYEHVVVLDWAIGNKSCEEAEKDLSSFACNENSKCYDSPSGVGYFCNCSQGYEGNPYVSGGCTDINECQHQGTNPGTDNCINTVGSVICECPPGLTGVGRKDGTGCSKPVKPEKESPLKVIFGTCLGLFFILALASVVSYSSRVKRRMLFKMRSEFFRQNGGWILQQRLASQAIDVATRIFTEKQLQQATDNFSENRILSRGGYGTVYKGVLANQQVVAVKRSKVIDEGQVEQFINEITILSKVNHRNVVRLLGCCLETQVPLLVYEFISSGTLFEHIHSQHIFPWERRIRISTETASAITYLHSAASFPIIHRDIKSPNILLDENITAKVSDFGASRCVPFDKTHLTTLVQGTIGYLDPEYFHTGQLTEKSDVYSFGVVLAELLTGEKPIFSGRPEEFHNLAMYFTVAFDEGRVLQVIDPPLAGEAGEEDLYAIAHLTRRCLNTRGEERPTMKDVALALDALRTRNPQIQRGNGGVDQLLIVRNLSSSETVECTKQHSLEGHLLSSMDLPR